MPRFLPFGAIFWDEITIGDRTPFLKQSGRKGGRAAGNGVLSPILAIFRKWCSVPDLGNIF
jgi:hypothetical protein